VQFDSEFWDYLPEIIGSFIIFLIGAIVYLLVISSIVYLIVIGFCTVTGIEISRETTNFLLLGIFGFSTYRLNKVLRNV